MTKKPATLQQRIEGDQSPTPPAALDQAILDYARSQVKPAAGWSHRLTAGWLPVLAAASVASVAVMIVLQQPTSTALHDATNSPALLQSEQSSPQLAMKQPSQKKSATASASPRQADAVAEETVAQQAVAEATAAKAVAANKVALKESRLLSQQQALSADTATVAKSRPSHRAAAGRASEPAADTQPAEALTAAVEPSVTKATLSLRQQLPAASTDESATYVVWGGQQLWQLQIGDREVRFIAADGTRHDFTALLSATEALGSGDINENGEQLLFQLSNDQHQLSVTLHSVRCEGGQQPDWQQFTVLFDDQSLQGCGKSLR
jgi:hypothetical protein